MFLFVLCFHMVALHCARNRNFYTAMTKPSEIEKNDLLG